MLVQTNNAVSLNTFKVQWALKAVMDAGLLPGAQIKEVLDDLQAVPFKNSLDVVHHLNTKAKAYSQDARFNIVPLLKFATDIITACGVKDNEQDVKPCLIVLLALRISCG